MVCVASELPINFGCGERAHKQWPPAGNSQTGENFSNSPARSISGIQYDVENDIEKKMKTDKLRNRKFMNVMSGIPVGRAPCLCAVIRTMIGVLSLGSGLWIHPEVQAQLILIERFDPSEVGSVVGLGFDNSADEVWVYGEFLGMIHSYSRAGEFIRSIERPGEAANDVDLDVAGGPMTLGEVAIPSGTLLMINGESGVAEIYAIDISSGQVLAAKATDFGMSHVVGGAFHAKRQTFFMVQDRQPAGSENDSVVAEIDPVTGQVIHSFQVSEVLPGFTVNYGDIEVSHVSGHLFIVSSDESTIAELTPSGELIQSLQLPSGISGLSGIAIDEARREAWLSNNSGIVFHLGNFPVEYCPTFSIRALSTSRIELCWPSIQDVIYQIEFRSDLHSGEWEPLSNPITGDGEVLKFQEDAATGQPHRYYRLTTP